MSTLRNRCTQSELRAHAVLDEVRVGIYHPLASVMWALRTLGEMS